MSQERYNQWVTTTSANQQNILCGGTKISENEKYFIDTYAKDIILDIGCGTGYRTFPVWFERKLNFYGFEKFQNLIDASEHHDKIILSDIGNVNFQKTIKDKLKGDISIAFLFGGVINGIIDRHAQERTWENFKFLLEKCDYLLIDTLTHFSWFNTEESGQVVELFHVVPPQYFYAKKEILDLNNKYGLEICKELTESIGHLKRTHYLITRKKNQY